MRLHEHWTPGAGNTTWYLILLQYGKAQKGIRKRLSESSSLTAQTASSHCECSYASSRARSYLKTVEATKHRQSFEGWVTQNVGAHTIYNLLEAMIACDAGGVLSQSDSSNSLQIYPGSNEMPMLPPIEPKTPSKLKIQLLRRYFNAKYGRYHSHNLDSY